MNQEKINLLNAMMEKPEVQEQAKQCKTPAELQALLAENGLNLTLDELEQFLDEVTKAVADKLQVNQELSEEDLGNVSGGLGNVAAAILGLGATPVGPWILGGAAVVGIGALIIGGINGYYSKKK